MNPTLPVKLVRNVRIPMPDGITLAADIHFPESALGENPAKFPAIIEYTPYHKNNNIAYGPRATRYPYFASHGYVFVNVDIRGTGDSEGFNSSASSPEEIADNLEVIRWCARQPWSEGSVGMIGISYTAGVCYDAARRAPPELKAIILCQMCSDWYSGMACPGGSPRPFGYENWAPLMVAYNFAPPNPDLVGPRWSEIWKQRLDNSRPWCLFQMEHLQDGPEWESRLLRNDVEKIQAATFLIGGWCDYYPDDFLRVYSKLRCPKRILVGPWTHNYPENAWPQPRLNDRYECLRWFDKHLKGIDTDDARPVELEPPVTLFVGEFTPPEALRREDNGRFQNEATWPPKHVQQQSFELGDSGRLQTRASAAESGTDQLVYRPDVGIAAGRYAIGQMLPGWGMADDQRLDEGLSLVYTSEPLTEPLEIIGAPSVQLQVSSTAKIAFVSAKICDVAPDGTSFLITKGVLNLTHRNSSMRPESLVPGEVYTVEVPLLATAHRLRVGHRLRLMIAGADFLNEWPTPLPHTLSIHRGGRTPSLLRLPVAGKRDSALPEPRFLPSDFPPLTLDQIPTPDYGVRRDLIKQAATVDIRTQSGIGVNRSQYTVNIRKPAEAVIRSDYEYTLDRPGHAILVRSQCVIRSDELAFHQLVEVDITVNGRPHWSKSWTTSVPREFC